MKASGLYAAIAASAAAGAVVQRVAGDCYQTYNIQHYPQEVVDDNLHAAFQNLERQYNSGKASWKARNACLDRVTAWWNQAEADAFAEVVAKQNQLHAVAPESKGVDTVSGCDKLAAVTGARARKELTAAHSILHGSAL